MMSIFKKLQSTLQPVFFLCVLTVPVNAYAIGNDFSKSWMFTVYLDDEEIGTHSFSVSDDKDSREIYTKASFDVKFLFFNAYSYRHENVESWKRGCLQRINAITDDNGDIYNVEGKLLNEKFVVNVTVNDELSNDVYEECPKSFAYWDSTFLNHSQLLNSQTGEVVAITSDFVAKENVTYKGEEIVANRYRIKGEDLQIDLWYSEDNHWLALESLTESGRVVRYSVQ